LVKTQNLIKYKIFCYLLSGQR